MCVCVFQNHLLASRKSFDAFFLRYPYCYGYWKKYADIEKKHGCIQEADEVRCLFVVNTQAVFCFFVYLKFYPVLLRVRLGAKFFLSSQVYRRGLQAIPLSVDLWLHYITFLKENQDTSDGEAENRIRA